MVNGDVLTKLLYWNDESCNNEDMIPHGNCQFDIPYSTVFRM